MVSSVADCCVSHTAQALLCTVNGDAVFRFLTLTFELGRDFYTMYLTAKFHRSTFSRSEVNVQTNTLTNKQTPLKIFTPVGNNPSDIGNRLPTNHTFDSGSRTFDVYGPVS